MISMLTLLFVAMLQQAPQRDGPARVTTLPVGTGSVSGVVMTDGESPQPVRFAGVSLSEGLLSLPRVVVSDEEGRFTISGLPEGSYTLTTQKAAWVPVASGVRGSAQVGQGTGQGVPVTVKAGEAVRGVTLRMAKGAVISGVVRLPGGRPAAGMSLQVLRTSRVDGRRSAAMTTIPGTTDDQGRYRVYGLEAGEYVVQVRSNMFGSLMGPGADLREVLPSEVRWAEAAAQQTTAPPPPPPALGMTVAYTTTYYPGTEYLSDAAALQVRAGEERLNIDFEIKRVPTTTVTGSVTGLDGTPVSGAMVTLNLPASTGQEDLFGQMLGASRTTSRADGTFVLTGVPPGAYQLVVRAAPPRPAVAPGRQAAPAAEAEMAAAMMAGVMGAMGGGVGGTMSLWAREPVAVAGSPVGPLGLQLREGLTVSGSLVFDGEPQAPTGTVRVSLAEPAAATGMPDLPMFRPGQSTVEAKPDHTFTVTGVVPGVYQLGVMMPGMRASLTTAGEGWVVKSATLGDRDLMDGGVDLTGGSGITGLVVTMTKRPSEITGRVLDSASQPFSAFPLVIFSADRAHWTPGSRRVKYVQPSTNGSFIFAGLPAGNYHLAAVTELDTKELASAAFLESLVGSAITVTLADGERKTQDVRLAGGRP
jgi:hypothetical protein